jgi:cytoskeletal protein CcmA (bactofilin family)
MARPSPGATVAATARASQCVAVVKGAIRALRVKLQDGGAVEDDIFHRSSSIDENSLFEGSSRQVEIPWIHHLSTPKARRKKICRIQPSPASGSR